MEMQKSSHVKIVILVDNNTLIDRYYLGEPAASYYIEAGDLRILFDTGYSDIFLANAKKLGVDLGKLTHIVLSHGHDDHTNGLRFLRDAFDLSGVPIIAHPDCFLPRRCGGLNTGSPYSPESAMQLFTCRPSAVPYELSPDCVFLGQIPRENDFECRNPIGERLYNCEWEEDFLLDDSALALRTEAGLFLVTGCSHSGICNILDYAKKVCHTDRIAGILGGFHLLDDAVRLKKTAHYLKQQHISRLYPCHCVSLESKIQLAAHLSISEVGSGTTLYV